MDTFFQSTILWLLSPAFRYFKLTYLSNQSHIKRLILPNIDKQRYLIGFKLIDEVIEIHDELILEHDFLIGILFQRYVHSEG